MNIFKADDEVLRKIVPGATITKSQVRDDYMEEAGENILMGYPLIPGTTDLILFLMILLLPRG